MNSHGLILHLPLNAIEAGNQVVDSSGNGQQGIAYNVSVVPDPTFGRALEFAGNVGSYVLFESVAGFPVTALTVECWVKSDANNDGVLVSYNVAGNDNRILCHDLANIKTYINNNAHTSNVALNDGQWHHLAVTWDSTTGELWLYRDGDAVATGGLSSGVPIPGGGMLVLGQDQDVPGGGFSDAQALVGKLAHVRLYDRALSQAEIQQDLRADLSGLVLHFPLNDVVAGAVVGESGYQQLGTIHGAPQVVPDERFGAALQFDGAHDYITMNGVTSQLIGDDYSVSLWLKTSVAEPSWGECVFSFHDPQGVNKLRLLNQNDVLGVDVVGAGGTAIINDGAWHHVAVIRRGSDDEYAVYVDGALDFTKAGTQGLVADDLASLAQEWDGQDPGDFYAGLLAHVRVHRRALSEAEIEQLMLDDQTAAGAFNRRHPIDFTLHDEDEHNVIYIDTPNHEHRLTVEIHNTSEQEIVLDDCGVEADAGANHHFALRFRPGTLRGDQPIASGSPDWAISALETAADGTQSLCLLRKGGATLAAKARVAIELVDAKADPRGGARGTRVELHYQNTRYATELASISGYRQQHLNIVNHLGKKHIPLHVGFVDAPTVLNDGATLNVVSLSVRNVDRERPMVFSAAATAAPSRLALSFDAGDPATVEWALATTSQIDGITVSYELDGATATVEKSSQGDVWVLEFADETTLAPGAALKLNIEGIVTAHPSGYTNVYLRYENIPGYWDGQFVVALEKSPLVVSGRDVGIGVAQPQAQLALGAANLGEAGETGGVQLHLGGLHNVGVNAGGKKLLIDGYDNDGAEVYPIYAMDENGQVDFYIKNRSTQAGKPAMFFAGDIQSEGRIRDQAGPVMPAGGIIRWSGPLSTIPEGWVLCDGNNGTPPLQTQFMVSEGVEYLVASIMKL